MRNYSHSQDNRLLTECEKVSIHKNNFDNVMDEFNHAVNLTI
ncbi:MULTISPECIES: type VI secretion system contractile sheath small subunit [Photorhabdus]|nr:MULTISPECIES: type VI secretion system contractile sheath small subunit [Photorhabdus]MCW7549290.1 type VI secretion system contractile sheath small subunit [Photorhabdus aballayi]